jgi:hypothetical protein
MIQSPTVQAVLGSGPVAQTLRQVLGCALVERNANDTGWNWPNAKSNGPRFLLVTKFDSSPSEIIRWHSDVWESPNTAQICCGIVGISDQSANILAKRDVFGRMEAKGETFEDWSNYIALIPRSASLTNMLIKTAKLIPCSVGTWRRRANEVSVIPRLLKAIAKRDVAQLNEILPAAILQDWDSVCFSHPKFGTPHAYANRIKSWLASVTSGVAPSWEKGESLLAPLATSR